MSREDPAGNGKFGSVLVVAAVLVLAGAVVYGALHERGAPDRHYLRAEHLVSRYETGREADVRDYEDPAYREALSELVLVAPGSVSADAAARMASEIERKLAAQRTRVRARSLELAQRQERRRRRDDEFFRAQRRSRLAPPIVHPGCAHEGPHAP